MVGIGVDLHPGQEAPYELLALLQGAALREPGEVTQTIQRRGHQRVQIERLVGEQQQLLQPRLQRPALALQGRELLVHPDLVRRRQTLEEDIGLRLDLLQSPADARGFLPGIGAPGSQLHLQELAELGLAFRGAEQRRQALLDALQDHGLQLGLLQEVRRADAAALHDVATARVVAALGNL